MEKRLELLYLIYAFVFLLLRNVKLERDAALCMSEMDSERACI